MIKHLLYILLILPLGTTAQNKDTLIVDATVYKPSIGSMTADGCKINHSTPLNRKIIAISRDLREFFDFGDTVRISGAGKLDGKYEVKDLMNKKWNMKIDILVPESFPLKSYDSVKVIFKPKN